MLWIALLWTILKKLSKTNTVKSKIKLGLEINLRGSQPNPIVAAPSNWDAGNQLQRSPLDKGTIPITRGISLHNVEGPTQACTSEIAGTGPHRPVALPRRAMVLDLERRLRGWCLTCHQELICPSSAPLPPCPIMKPCSNLPPTYCTYSSRI